MALVKEGSGTHVEELRKVCESVPVDEQFEKVADCVERAPKEVLEQLSDKAKVTSVFEEMLEGIKNETSQDLKGFEEYMKERLQKVKEASEPILCRIKRAMSSQTFQARKNDVETQYNKTDITRLRKGK